MMSGFLLSFSFDRVDAEAVAREEEQDHVPLLDRLQEGIELLVEICLRAQIGRDGDVLAVESGLFEIDREILGIRDGTIEPLDVPVAVALDSDDERPAGLGLRRRGERYRPHDQEEQR
jgi:hypothetical protein